MEESVTRGGNRSPHVGLTRRIWWRGEIPHALPHCPLGLIRCSTIPLMYLVILSRFCGFAASSESVIRKKRDGSPLPSLSMVYRQFTTAGEGNAEGHSDSLPTPMGVRCPWVNMALTTSPIQEYHRHPSPQRLRENALNRVRDQETGGSNPLAPTIYPIPSSADGP